jgi:enoyl-CoA hydratase/carnithine racemase
MTGDTTGTVRTEITGGIALLTLDRPGKLNAVTDEMSGELLRAVERLDADDAIRVGVLTGAGTRAFCVGSDIGQVGGYADPWAFRNRQDYCTVLRSVRKPLIAAINGYAYGGGLELALSCDIRLASRTSSFAAAEIKLGWIGGGGVSALLSASVPASDAALLLLTGDPVDAAEAHRMGLVSRLHEPGELLPAALALAGTIAQRPPIAAQSAKANLLAARSMGLAQAIQYEREMQAICMGTRDAAEGRQAFAEKRPGRFTGH